MSRSLVVNPLKLPHRPTVSGWCKAGTLLVRRNTLGRLYDPLNQGLLGQVLVSAGPDRSPYWGNSTVLPAGNIGDILSINADGYTWINPNTINTSLVKSAVAVENIAVGQPIYHVIGSDKVGIARADTITKSCVAGIATQTVITNDVANYIMNGFMYFTAWSLSRGNIYYLAPTGGITSTRPTTVSQVVVNVGVATGSKSLEISIKQTILL